MAKLKGLFFDFNGVIKDDEPPWFKAWQTIHARHGIALSEHHWARIRNTTDHPDYWLQQFTGERATTAEHREATDIAVAELERTKILPGVEELLIEAKQRNIVTALVTNSDENWIKRWFPAELSGHFVVQRTRGTRDLPKPDAQLYAGVLRFYSLGGSEVVGIEDTPRGVTALLNAGIHPLYVPSQINKHISLDVPTKPSLEGVTIDSLEAMLNLPQHDLAYQL